MSTKPIPFSHLHLHSEHSPLDGACRMNKLMDRVKDLGMESVGLTDHGTMSGLLKFQNAADKAGVKPILGLEAYFTEDRFVKDASNRYYHLTLLAETTKGYENLCKLSSQSSREGMYYKPRMDYEMLKENSEGIIVLTGCMASRTMQKLMDGDLAESRQEIKNMMECVGEENVYLELQNVGIKGQLEWNAQLAKFAKELKRPTVGTADVHYLLESDADPHDAMLCVQMKTTLDNPSRMSLLPNKYYLRSPEEMLASLKEQPECLQTTVQIADRCNARIEVDRTFELLPAFPIPEHFDHPDRNSPPPKPPKRNPSDEAWLQEWFAHLFLREQVMIGLHKRYSAPIPAEVMERMEFEMVTILNMGVTDYFLIVWDLLREAHERGIPSGPGRGSGAGSMVLYALDVTQLDPLEHGLLFERFLNPDRISMPDVDLDFSPVRRKELMDYMRDYYGDDKVAQIITFGRIGSKAGIRRAAQAMGKDFLPLADKLAKAIPTKGTVAAPLAQAELESPEFQQIVRSSPDAQKILELAKWMEGMIQNEGVHAAALIVSPIPVDNVVPVQTNKDGNPVSAFDMKDAEGVGLLKLDFLGLRNLDVIAEAERLIKKHRNVDLDAWHVPIDDAKTYEMLAKGDSVGVFQFESAGMSDSLVTIGADRFADLVAIVALYRPGPMANIPVYARRKRGLEPLTYGDPRLEEILGETQGIVCYQEQSMMVARQLAGFTPGEADGLRKAIGKKLKDKMDEMKPKFYAGCKKNNVPAKVIEEQWATNEASAEYSFNKSHAAAYALVSYVTAYLKANYPPEYMAALMSSVMSTKDKVPFYLYETKKMGLTVHPPDVNASFSEFEPEGDNGIRFGLTAIKGVGEAIVDEIAREREANGRYKSLWDFAQRVDGLNRREVEALVKAGAFDSTGDPRKGLLTVVEQALKQAKSIRKKESEGQSSLFDVMGDSAEDAFGAMEMMETPRIPDEEYTEMERFALEREVAGIYVSGHPLDHAQAAWEQVRHVGIGQITEEHIDRILTVAGIVTHKRVIFTRRDNKKMLVVTVEDLTGSREIVVFPKTLEQQQCERHLEEGNLVAIRAAVAEDDRGFAAQAQGDDEAEEGAAGKQTRLSLVMVFPFDPTTVTVPEFFEVRLEKAQLQQFVTVRGVLEKYPGTRPVRVTVLENGEQIRQGVLTDLKVEPSEALMAEILATLQ